MPEIPLNAEGYKTDSAKPSIDWAAADAEAHLGFDPFTEFEVEDRAGAQANQERILSGVPITPETREKNANRLAAEALLTHSIPISKSNRQKLASFLVGEGIPMALDPNPQFTADMRRNAQIKHGLYDYIDGQREILHPLRLKSQRGGDQTRPVRFAQAAQLAEMLAESKVDPKPNERTRSKRENALAELTEFSSALNSRTAAATRDALKNEYNYKMIPASDGEHSLGKMEFRGGVSLDKKLQAAGAEALASGRDVVVAHGKHQLYVTPETDLVEKFKDMRGFDDRQARRRDLPLSVEETAEGRRLQYEGKDFKRAVQAAIEETRSMKRTVALNVNGIDLGEVTGNSKYQELKAKYDQARKQVGSQAVAEEKKEAVAKVEPEQQTEVEAVKKMETAVEAKSEPAAPARRVDFGSDNMTIERFSHPSGFSLVRDRTGQTDAQSLMKPQYRILSDKGEAVGTFTGRLSMNGQEKIYAFPSRSMLADELKQFETVAEQMGLRKTEPGKAMSAFAESDVPVAGELPQSQARREMIDNREAEFAPGYESRMSFFYPAAEESVEIADARMRAQEEMQHLMKEAEAANRSISDSKVRESKGIVAGGKAASIAGGAAAVVTVLTKGAEAAGILK